jgi:hypothetical protein
MLKLCVEIALLHLHGAIVTTIIILSIITVVTKVRIETALSAALSVPVYSTVYTIQ